MGVATCDIETETPERIINLLVSNTVWKTVAGQKDFPKESILEQS